jgi:hypothetical protein
MSIPEYARANFNTLLRAPMAISRFSNAPTP